MNEYITKERQIELLFPIFENTVPLVSKACSQSFKKDYSKAEHWLVMGRRESDRILNQHVIEKYWNGFELYFLASVPLYYYIEEPISNLVNKPTKFWYFFSAKAALEQFRHIDVKTNNFKKENIYKFPFLNIEPAVIAAIVEQLKMEEDKAPKKMEKIDELFQLSDIYLKERINEKYLTKIKNHLFKLTVEEINLIKLDLSRFTDISASLERRLLSVFNISWKYFESANKMENQYLNKILASEKEEILKGLNLVLKKMEV